MVFLFTLDAYLFARRDLTLPEVRSALKAHSRVLGVPRGKEPNMQEADVVHTVLNRFMTSSDEVTKPDPCANCLHACVPAWLDA